MQKTHAPTRRRTERALREGDSPLSLPAVRAGALLVFTFLAPAAAGAVRARFQTLLRDGLSRPESAKPATLAAEVVLSAGPILAAVAVASLALGLIQTRAVFTWSTAAPRFDRMNPSLNLARLGSALAGYEALRGLAVTAALVLVAGRSLVVTAPDLASAVGGNAFPATGLLSRRALWSSALALAALAAVDLAVKRASWRQRWRMSARDLADERRESEGDPEVKRARRRAHQQLDEIASR